MKLKIEEYFVKSRRYTSDCYVADYTDKTGSQTGVVMSGQPFGDIAFFHLKKHTPSNIEYIGINIEEHPSFTKGIENCECMFVSVSDARKPWLLMLEMKYCGENNIDDYAYKAYSQMKSTLDKVDNLELIDSRNFNRYFVYSVPEHGDRSPFGAFTLSQNETLRRYEKDGIRLLGNNKMLIATPSYLFEPGKTI